MPNRLSGTGAILLPRADMGKEEARLKAMETVVDEEENFDTLTFSSVPGCPRHFTFRMQDIIDMHGLPINQAMELVAAMVEEFQLIDLNLSPVDIYVNAHAIQGVAANVGANSLRDTAMALQLAAAASSCSHDGKQELCSRYMSEEVLGLGQKYDTATLRRALENYVHCLNRRIDAIKQWWKEVELAKQVNAD